MADDSQNDPSEQGFPSELDSSAPYAGNRPASGARRATPGEVLSQGFQGAETAGDFLGLDTEFTASQDPYGAGGLDLVPLPTTQHDDPQMDPAYAPQAPAPMPDSDPVQDFAQAPSAFEFGEDLGSEGGEFAPVEEPVASKKPLLVGALLAAVLGAGGYLYGPRLYSRYFVKPTEVASVPTAAPKSPRVATPDAGSAKTPPSDTSAAVQPSASQPIASEPVKDPESAPAPQPTRTFEPVAVSPEPDGPLADLESAPETLGASLSPAVGPPASFPDLKGSEFEWASEDQLELIWRGSEVPLEALKAPAKTIMPRVGNVRVFMSTGDIFEGHLYAVGQNRVWMDTEPGRIGLDGDKVARIEVLPPLPANAKAGDSELGVGGKRVRVRVPGGMLYGRVLKAEGDEVTLALETGGRVRVKTSELEDLGPGRAVVVRR